ncbi:4'-phosphopantetheinyl transferase family protein [Nocardioides sp. LHG3406-4]|uniref:4'-phosphopantetheinyl transferase family protein n=1 Tax=Nocardioides sp. LHG3406-4 TaxID=2804575 RepID=UPI003CF547F5
MTWARLSWARTGEPRAADHLVRHAISLCSARCVGSLTVGHLCPQCGSDRHGRPFVRGWQGAGAPAISAARTTGITVIAVTSDGSIGVDVEDLVRFDDVLLAEVLLHPDESASTPSELATTWVRKEAVLKAHGVGLALDPRTIRLAAPGEVPTVIEGPASGSPYWVRDIRLDPQLRVAVAGSGAGPDELTVREVAPEELPGRATGRTGRPAHDPW